MTHTIHVWYIYLHLVDFLMVYLGKYTSTMDALGDLGMTFTRTRKRQ